VQASPEDSATAVGLIFSELTAELQRQSDSLGDLRTRASTIFGLAGSVTAFFGLQTFTTVTNARPWEILAATAYVLAALATAYILMPVGDDWKLDRVGPDLLGAVNQPAATTDELQRKLNTARAATYSAARPQLKSRTRALSLLTLFLAVSAAGWALSLILGTSG
jgi:hypothetical protein